MEVGAIPPASLRGNSRAHHMVKYREGRDWRESGEMHAYVAAPGVHHVEKIRITFTWYHWRKIDIPNLLQGMKGWVDGLVDADFIDDDDPDHVTYGEHQFVKVKKGQSKTEVLIEELG